MKKKDRSFLSRVAAGLSSAAVAMTFTLQTGAGMFAHAEDVLLGDVNGDGQVDWDDHDLLDRVLTGEASLEDLSSFQAGDVNRDGGIGIADLMTLEQMLDGEGSEEETTDPKDVLLGDIDGDGQVFWSDYEIMKEYLYGFKTTEVTDLKAWDLNADNTLDLADLNILAKFLNGEITELPYTGEYEGNSFDVRLALANGDVDLDGAITEEDARLIQDYVIGRISHIELAGAEGASIYGDFNCDDKVDSADAAAILQYVEEGDVAFDYIGEPTIDKNDYELELMWTEMEPGETGRIKGRLVIDGDGTQYIGIEGVIGTDSCFTISDWDADQGIMDIEPYTGAFSWIMRAEDSQMIFFDLYVEVNVEEEGHYPVDLYADVMNVAGISSDRVKLSNGVLTVRPETTYPEDPYPEDPYPPEEEPVTFKEQALVNGDVDVNGYLTTVDAYMIMNYAAGLLSNADFPLTDSGGVVGDGPAVVVIAPQQAYKNRYFGDFNCDGKINTADAAAILQYLDEGDSFFPKLTSPSTNEIECDLYLSNVCLEKSSRYAEGTITFEVPDTDAKCVSIEGKLAVDGDLREMGLELTVMKWENSDAYQGQLVYDHETGEFSMIIPNDGSVLVDLTFALSSIEYEPIVGYYALCLDADISTLAGSTSAQATSELEVFGEEIYVPDPIEPDPIEPDPIEPEPTEPASTEPEPTEPAPTEPEPTEPVLTTESEPTEPEPTEPAPTEPETTPYSEEQLIEWAMYDYETRNGAAPADAQLTENEDDTVSIVLTDAAGEILETYVIDPVTGEGVFGDGTYVTLPQTGRYDMTNYYIAFGALLCVGMGLFLVIRSGLLRKKREN